LYKTLHDMKFLTTVAVLPDIYLKISVKSCYPNKPAPFCIFGNELLKNHVNTSRDKKDDILIET
jgi:hypothetical protein